MTVEIDSADLVMGDVVELKCVPFEPSPYIAVRVLWSFIRVLLARFEFYCGSARGGGGRVIELHITA